MPLIADFSALKNTQHTNIQYQEQVLVINYNINPIIICMTNNIVYISQKYIVKVILHFDGALPLL